MYYSLQGETTPVYEKDDDGNVVYYTDKDGNQIPMTTGETETEYETPVEMMASISFSSGEAEAKEYGIDTGAYDSVMVTQLDAYPLSETSVIWKESEIVYKDDENTIPDEKSADFRVVAVKNSIAVSKYLLQRITK